MTSPFEAHNPTLGEKVFVAPDAQVIGQVELGDECSVFFGAVLRGDILPIRIGSRTNIQEHAVLHTSHDRTPTIVGDEVTIGHKAIIHGATVGNRVIVGMGSIILDEAVIGDECLIGAGSIITPGKHFPRHSLILGSPAKVVRQLTEEEVAFLKQSADGYVKTASSYLSKQA